MKKSIFLLLAVSICIAGCATAKNKKPVATESYGSSSQASVSDSEYAASAAETTEQAVSASSAPVEEAKPATTLANMTKKDVQLALQKAGFYKGAIDGKYGPKTREALREFQKANGLAVDGLAGKKTKSALLKEL